MPGRAVAVVTPSGPACVVLKGCSHDDQTPCYRRRCCPGLDAVRTCGGSPSSCWPGGRGTVHLPVLLVLPARRRVAGRVVAHPAGHLGARLPRHVLGLARLERPLLLVAGHAAPAPLRRAVGAGRSLHTSARGGRASSGHRVGPGRGTGRDRSRKQPCGNAAAGARRRPGCC